MKIYTVGGYVRDKIMGIEPKDRDYVVVGSTPEEMEALGYEQSGKDFPVFRHPETKDEYALARTERKTGLGYNGFDVQTASVSLEEDLFRRDLTMNAMAMTEQGVIIDPYHGQKDIEARLLRHVSVHFKEDPVRILRIARFSARYNFDIAPETIILMKEMVANGEFDHLTGERVWKEFEKVLGEPYVKNFFSQLEKIGALERVPGFSSIHEKDFYRENYDLNLLHTFSQMPQADLKKWKMPSDEQQRIQTYSYWKNQSQFYSELSNEDKLLFVAKTKALHQPEKAEEMLEFIHAYQEWKGLHVRTLENEKKQFLHDLSQLKAIDYEMLVKDALANKEKPQEVVKKAQLAVLQPKKQLRIK